MTDQLKILPRPITQVERRGSSAQPATGPGQATAFDSLLQSKLATPEVKFSRHATERLQQRSIDVSAAQVQRLNQAVAQLESKGGRDSLVLLDNLAMVVSVKNQTVVTVAEQQQLQNQIFTNIDSAVIA